MSLITVADRAGLEPSVGLSAATASRTQRRWQVLYQQMQCDHEPCFQTEKRHLCRDAACPWRVDCLALRAEWRR